MKQPTHTFLGAFIVGMLFIGTSVARAEERGTVVVVPPGTRVIRVPANAYLHDGYYQRVMLGAQYTRFWGQRDGQGASLESVSPAIYLAIGGSPVPGLAIGGMFGSTSTWNRMEGAPEEEKGYTYASAHILGPFMDWYPRPKGGWHVGASIGLGGGDGRDGSGNSFSIHAPGAVLFGGFDGWVGPQYSLGIGLIAQGSVPAEDKGSPAYRFATASVGFQSTLLYH